jgi:dTDP-4-dehydrorhamnose 3,5-epimerase
MEIISTRIPDVKIIRPRKHVDERGFFSEVYSRQVLADAGIDVDFVQDNHSLSTVRGVIRGLHFQASPFAQAKLVRVTRGAIFDVALDVRRNSPTFGQHVGFVLSANNWEQALLPVGFAHGFATLSADTEVLYKVSNYYAPTHDRGVLWNDPALGIEWPFSAEEAVISEKDRQFPRLAEAADLFD